MEFQGVRAYRQVENDKFHGGNSTHPIVGDQLADHDRGIVDAAKDKAHVVKEKLISAKDAIGEKLHDAKDAIVGE